MDGPAPFLANSMRTAFLQLMQEFGFADSFPPTHCVHSMTEMTHSPALAAAL